MDYLHDNDYKSTDLGEPLFFLIRRALFQLPSNFKTGIRIGLRDFRIQYRGNFFGVFWALFSPLLFSLAFIAAKRGGEMAVGESSVSTALFLLIGFSLYQVWFEALMSNIEAIKKNKDLVGKLKLPVDVLVFGNLVKCVLSLGIRLSMVGAACLYFGGGSVLGIPGFLGLSIALIINGTAFGIFLLPISTLFGDVRQAIGSLSIGIIFVSSIVNLPSSSRGDTFYYLDRMNPLASILNTARDALLGVGTGLEAAAIVWIGVSLIVFVVMLGVLRRISPVLIERLGN